MSKKVILGIVTRVGQNTLAVFVQNQVVHPVYHKSIKQRKTFLVDNPLNTCAVGDRVKAVECAPVSKRKSWVFESKLD